MGTEYPGTIYIVPFGELPSAHAPPVQANPNVALVYIPIDVPVDERDGVRVGVRVNDTLDVLVGVKLGVLVLDMERLGVLDVDIDGVGRLPQSYMPVIIPLLFILQAHSPPDPSLT